MKNTDQPQNVIYKPTIYDDVWRTIVHDFSCLLIALINELFDEHYDLNTDIQFLQDVHEKKQPDGTMEKRITDTCFRIKNLIYHVECQSRPDNSMLIRMFEYGAAIALDRVEKKNDKIRLKFPHAAVLFLTSNKKTPDEMEIEICTPGGSISYKIPVAKMENYTIEQIFQKKLLILLPFYLFTIKKSLKIYNENEEKRQELVKTLNSILIKLNELSTRGDIDEHTKRSIIDLMKKVNHQLTHNYKNVQKEAEAIMGGKILDYEAKTIFKEGTIKTLINLVKKNRLSIEDAAEEAQMTVPDFKEKMTVLI